MRLVWLAELQTSWRKKKDCRAIPWKTSVSWKIKMISPKKYINLFFLCLSFFFYLWFTAFLQLKICPGYVKHLNQNRVKLFKQCNGKSLCFGVTIYGTYFVRVYRGNLWFQSLYLKRSLGLGKCCLAYKLLFSIIDIFFNSVTCNFHPLWGHLLIFGYNTPFYWNWWFGTYVNQHNRLNA